MPHVILKASDWLSPLRDANEPATYPHAIINSIVEPVWSDDAPRLDTVALQWSDGTRYLAARMSPDHARRLAAQLLEAAAAAAHP